MAVERPEMTRQRQLNQALNIEEFKAGEPKLKSLPLAVFVELTQNCNLSCPMCRSAEGYNKEWNLAEAHFEKLVEEVFPSALVVDLRGFGESTLLKNFPQYVSRTLATGVKLRLVTNGQVNRTDTWDEMMAHSSMVSVSCDAATEETFAILRRGGTIAKLRRTVEALVGAREANQAPRDSISLTVAVSRLNLPELPDIVRLAADLDVSRVILFPIVIDNDHEWNLRGDLDGTVRALEEAAKTADSLNIDLQLGASLDPALTVDDKVKTACMHPWSFAYVSYSGRVGFCDHLIGSPELTFESLKDRSFAEIWNGKGFQGLRRGHAARSIPSEFSACNWCFKSRYVDFEHLLHPDYAASMVSTSAGGPLLQIHPPSSRPAEMFG